MATPTPIYEVAEEKFTVCGNECYGTSQSNAANFDVKENECYGVALNSFPNSTSNCNGQPKCDDLGNNSGKTGKAVAVLFVLLLTLLLGVVAACVALALEISDLKSEIASLRRASLTETPGTGNVTQLLSQEILHTNEQLNSSLSAIQELTTELQLYWVQGVNMPPSLWTPVLLSLPPPSLVTTGSGPPLALLYSCTVTQPGRVVESLEGGGEWLNWT